MSVEPALTPGPSPVATGEGCLTRDHSQPESGDGRTEVSPSGPQPTSAPPLPSRRERGSGGEGHAAPSFLAALRGIRRRGDYDEILDRPGVPSDLLARNLADLRLMNRCLGWSAGVWREVRGLLPAGVTRATLLDVATGSGDVPRALARRAARDGIRLRLIGSDASAAVLADAARQRGTPMRLVRHDATALPFRDGAVDVATLCLAAHHFDPPELRRALVELRRVARRGVVVSDLERGAIAYVGARLMALVLRNRLTAHDGPISVLRAYTPRELSHLAREAGWSRFRIRRRFPFRMILIADGGAA